MNGYVLIILGIVCLVISIALIVISLVRMRKDAGNQKLRSTQEKGQDTPQENAFEDAKSRAPGRAVEAAGAGETVRKSYPDVENSEATIRKPKVVPYLVTLEETDDPGKRFEHEMKEDLKIGRDAALNDIALPDSSISRLHCRIVNLNGSFYVNDTGTKGNGSTYGTYINGTQLVPGKAKQIFPGDRLKVGDVEYTIWFSKKQ